MAFDGYGVNVPLGFFVIPLPILSLPDFALAALSAEKRQVNIELRKVAVRVYVRKFGVICGYCGGVLFLLCG